MFFQFLFIKFPTLKRSNLKEHLKLKNQFFSNILYRILPIFHENIIILLKLELLKLACLVYMEYIITKMKHAVEIYQKQQFENIL
jgi:hypothetical protein